MGKIKVLEKVSETPLDEKTGLIFNGENIENKAENTYSAETIDKIVEEYSGVEEGTIVDWDDTLPIPEGWEEVEDDVEIVTNNNGTAIKYPNGTMIVCQKYIVGISTWGAWGSMYSTKLGVPPNFPVPFVGSIPTVTQTLETNSGNAILCTSSEEGGMSSLTRAGACQLVRPTAGSASTFTVNIIAIGRWK